MGGDFSLPEVVAQFVGGRMETANLMDHLQALIDPSKQFAKDSIRLVKRCTKPDRKEYQKIAVATAVGFAIMGFIGFFVKLIHIPINNIIVGG
ncbi:unnamed protein product [Cercopithifilaria johnstoni]|uniref:Protein transport protein Sec61 subunit gamma n=1 Tax=Cercopithifilaria johnstoni TaxID=2874296 RepID=A0A8J2MQV3_9BILA|nr:unnamed protein product [Cercopithifilaria johnstoni]